MALLTAPALAFFLLGSAAGQTGPRPSPTPPTSLPAATWAQAAADREVRIIQDDGTFPLSYRTRKIDDKRDITREVVESREGTVARLVERDGRLLSRLEDDDERKRLADMLAHPEDFLRHHKRDDAMREYSVDLVRQFPRAMLFRYTPGQPQLAHGRAPQVVVDFEADPAFKPPTLVAQALTGLEGRLWIDVPTHTLARVEARVTRPVNFGWGMLARLHPGGTVMFEQSPVGGDRWVYSQVEDHLRLREVMVHSTEQNIRMSAWNFQLLPGPIGFQDAVRSLLAMPVPLRP